MLLYLVKKISLFNTLFAGGKKSKYYDEPDTTKQKF